MKHISCDIETYSSVNLSKAGVYRYSQSEDFEIILFGYSMDGDSVEVVDLANGENLPDYIRAALLDPTVIKWGHNSSFERVCLSRYLGLPQGQYLDPSSWRCTMIWAATLGLPLSLEGVGTVLGLEKQKLKEGRDLIRYFCMPGKLRDGRSVRHYSKDAPEKWERFKAYNIRDVETEMAIQQKLAKYPVPAGEWQHYRLDQQINDRGIMLDMPLVRQAIQCDAQYRQAHMDLAKEVTGLENPNSTAQMKSWLGEQGIETDSLSKASVLEMLDKAEGTVELALSLRQELAKSSVKKYAAMENAVCQDQRARGLTQFHGAARTGRWCLTGDHEVLTTEGWCRLDEWGGGRIACWQPKGEAVSFQKAEHVEFEYNGTMYEYNDKRISQVSTPDHKMFVKRNYSGSWQIDTVEQMAMYRPSIPFTGYRGLVSGAEHHRLRVIVMIQADGHYKEDGSITLSLKKQRKIERCKMLLRRAHIEFTLHSYEISGVTTISVNSRYVPMWLRIFRDKTFGSWLFDENPDVFFDEIAYWDGYNSAKNSVQYVTCNRQNADMVQAFAHLSGRSALLKVRNRSEAHQNWNDVYIVDIWMTPKNCHEIREKPKTRTYNGIVHCAVTTTGFFLVRRNGRVWVTGNSGRLIQTQNLPANHLVGLDNARQLIRSGNYQAVEMLYDSVPLVLSELIRTAFIPMPGNLFFVADFSAIEARVIAWLAGEDWRLKVFENGGDIYCASASQMFHLPVEKNGVNGHLRQKGKIAELACIAENSLVLTDKGLIPIQSVEPEMLLWDGCEWVKHGGVIFKGEREVMEYEGLRATHDHLVWVEGASEPVRFEEAVAASFSLVHTGDACPTGGSRGFLGESRVYDIRNAGPRNRYTVSGKLVHNCGYGGSVGALKAMGALEMGVPENELPVLIKHWRSANPNIVQFWWDVDRAAKTCITERTTTDTHGIRFQYQSGFLFIALPSGRRLAYVKPRIGENRFGGESVTYEGTASMKKWDRIESYGPKFVENIVQATARDILAETMLRLDAAGYRIVMHVHDEVVIEAPGTASLEDICTIMGQTPAWAKGLLLRAEGFKCDHYKKE